MNEDNRLSSMLDDLCETAKRCADPALQGQDLMHELARAKTVTEAYAQALRAIELRLEASKLVHRAARYQTRARPPDILREPL